MSDRTQIGPNVDAELWSKFREHVKDRHGQTRGVLGNELENAIRNYIHYGPNQTPQQQFAEFNERLQRIEGAVGTAASDGGADTFEPESHTHAPPEQKPAANAATEKKVAYLAECVLDEEVPNTREITAAVPKATLRQVVKDEYGFRSDTAKRYVTELIDHFGLQNHPENNQLLVTEEWIEDYISSETTQ